MGGQRHVWIHFTMAGKILRLKDIFLTDDEILVLTFNWYSLFPLIFGLHRRDAGRVRELYRTHGLEGLIKAAKKVERIPYNRVMRLRLVGRKKAMRPYFEIITDKKREIFRIHDKEFNFDSIKTQMEKILKDKKIEVIFE